MRLIDADELLKILQEQQKIGSVNDSRGRAKAILEVIHAPAVDADPVKHGRWIIHREKIFKPNRSECYMSRPLPTECSVCGFAEMRASRFAFCPNCGARMDGDNND